jgi:hypothetical protein
MNWNYSINQWIKENQWWGFIDFMNYPLGWKHIRVPKKCNHKNCFPTFYHTFVEMKFHNWKCNCEIWGDLISLELGLIIFTKCLLNDGDLKMYEYIYHKIIPIIKFENLKLYCKSGVVGGMFALNFRWWMIKLIQINKFYWYWQVSQKRFNVCDTLDMFFSICKPKMHYDLLL